MKCWKCGKEFYTYNGRVIICEECRKELDRNSVSNCVICGNPLKEREGIRTCVCNECSEKYIAENGYTKGALPLKIKNIDDAISDRISEIMVYDKLKNGESISSITEKDKYPIAHVRRLISQVKGEAYDPRKAIDSTERYGNANGANEALGWPYNLLSDIVGIEEVDNINFHEYENGVMEVLKCLPERTRSVILYYYKDYMLKTEIGKIYGITKERVRQIISKGVEELRKIDFKTLEEKEQSSLSDSAYSLTEERKEIKEKEKELKESVLKTLSGIKIGEMGLSIRSVNALRNNGFFTAADIFDHFADRESYECNIKEIMSLDNIGVKSAIEIHDTMKKITDLIT